MVMENTRLVLSRTKHAKKISSLLHNHQYSEPLMQGRMDPYAASDPTIHMSQQKLRVNRTHNIFLFS